MVRVVGVGEGDLEPAASYSDLLEVKHGRGAHGEVLAKSAGLLHLEMAQHLGCSS
jgi:hypothetical protein